MLRDIDYWSEDGFTLPSLKYVIGLEAMLLLDYLEQYMGVMIQSPYTDSKTVDGEIWLDTDEKEVDGKTWLRKTYHAFTQEIETSMKIRQVKHGLAVLNHLGLILSSEAESKASKWYAVDEDNYHLFMQLWIDHRCPRKGSIRPFGQWLYKEFMAEYQQRRSTKQVTFRVKESVLKPIELKQL